MKIHTHRFERTVKKTLIVVAIMIGWAIAGGIIYVYITGRNTPQNTPPAVVPIDKPPIPEPTAPGPNAPNGASVQYIETPVKPGENSNIIVTTGPNSICKIVVAYSDVISKDSGLADKTADVHGSVAWTWTVDKTAAPGKWPVKVTCDRNKRIAYVEGYLEVTK
jgi:hypothetical protein